MNAGYWLGSVWRLVNRWWVWGLAYLTAIFIFAAIYVTLPRPFFHATAQFEQSVQSMPVALSDSLTSNIVRDVRLPHLWPTGLRVEPDGSFLVGGWRIRGGDLRAGSVRRFEDPGAPPYVNRPEDLRARFELLVPATDTTGMVMASVSGEIVIDLFDLPTDSMIVFASVRILSASAPQVGIRATSSPTLRARGDSIVRSIDQGFGLRLVRSAVQAAAESQIMGLGYNSLPLTSETMSALRDYVAAVNGFPAHVRNSYGRMLYVSAVIITTLGLGDVVPITGMARLWTGVEAVLGIVFIGLFLNSVAGRGGHQPTRAGRQPRFLSEMSSAIGEVVGYGDSDLIDSVNMDRNRVDYLSRRSAFMRNNDVREEKVPSGFVRFAQANWLTAVIVLGLVAGCVGVAALLMRPEQTKLELALETVILTGLSISASVLATKVYAETTSSSTLRDRGVQIASAIMNLKSAIEELSDWLGRKRTQLSESEPNNSADELMEHVEFTLRGFSRWTNAALGGVGGVIGDALAQYQTTMERIADAREEGDRRTLALQGKLKEAGTTEEFANLQREIRDVALQTERKIEQLTRRSALPIPDAPAPRLFTARCPNCGRENELQMLDRPGETKRFNCVGCFRGFNAHVVTDGNVLIRPLGGRGIASTGVIRALSQADLRVEPSELKQTISLVLSAHENLTQEGGALTPLALQAATFEMTSGVPSRTVIRRVLKGVYRGGGFSQIAPAFGAPYSNLPTEVSLANAFSKACIESLSDGLVSALGAASGPGVAKLLLDDLFPASEEVVLDEFLKKLTRIAERRGNGQAG